MRAAGAQLRDQDLVDLNAKQLAGGDDARFDELRSYGLEGLWKAESSFDESRGVPYRKYANLKIRGAMIDGLRAADPLSRLQRKSDSRPTFIEFEPHHHSESYAIEDSGADDRSRMLRCVLRLPPAERTLILAHTVIGVDLSTVGESLGISKSWASRRLDSAMGRVREMLDVDERAAAAVIAGDVPGRRGPPWKHGRDIRASVVAYINEGKTHQAIATMLGLPRSTVGDIAKRAGARRTGHLGRREALKVCARITSIRTKGT